MSKILGEIIVSAGSSVLKTELKTSYFSATTLPIEQARPDDLRLRLDEIKTSDNSHPYKFNYYGDDAGEYKLPAIDVVGQQDAWGFYNGKLSNTNIPSYNDYYDQKIILVVSGSPPTENTVRKYYYLEGADLTPSFPHSCANTIKRIEYPTGGLTEFEFEANSYFNDVDEIPFGGIRIKKITDRTGPNNTAGVREYAYNEYSSDYAAESIPLKSSGQPLSLPININEAIIFETSETDNLKYSKFTTVLELNSNSYLSLYDYVGNYVGYSHVLEKNNNGTVLYNFYSAGDFPNQYHSRVDHIFCWGSDNVEYLDGGEVFTPLKSPFSNRINGDVYKRGLLKAQVTYNNAGVIVQKTVNNFNFIDSPDKIYGNEYYQWPRDDAFEGEVNTYYYTTGRSELESVTTKNYSINGDYLNESIVSYTYNPNDLLKSQKQTLSNKQILQTNYKYPFDVSQNVNDVYGKMNSLNVIKNVVEEEVVKINPDRSTVPVSKTTTNYNNWGAGNNWVLKPSSIELSIGSFAPVNKASVNFDTEGNLISINEKGINTVYIYGYKNSFPVAKIENALYDNSGNIVDNKGNILLKSVIDNLKTFAGTREQYITELNNIRSSLTGAMVTTYTYDLMMGMTSHTDASGRITFYEYNSSQKLRYIKDQEGKIIKAYCYNYAGQPTDCFVNPVPPPPPPPPPPVTIYARVEISRHYYWDNTDANSYTDYHDADLSLKLYSNASCTIPYVLTSDVVVTIANDYYHENSTEGIYSDTTTTFVTVDNGTSGKDLGNYNISTMMYSNDPYYGYYTDYISYQFYTKDDGNNTYISKPTLQ